MTTPPNGSHMRIERAFTTITLALFGVAVVYTGGYLASVTRVQGTYGSPSGFVVVTYDYTWQRELFSPIEQLDRLLFPARWRYELKLTDPTTYNPARRTLAGALSRTAHIS